MTSSPKKMRPYKLVKAAGHFRQYSDGRIKEHILIAEKVLGHALPAGSHVHHSDGDPQNNINSNLVICQDSAYHQIIHLRMRALRESGNANNRWCAICKTWDLPENLICGGTNTTVHHECKKQKDRDYYASNVKKFRIKNARNYRLRQLKGIPETPISMTEYRLACERRDRVTIARYLAQFSAEERRA